MLVGGFGTRLRPLTITTPKPMLPIVNVPLLELELLHLKDYGVDEVILSTGYLPDVFDEYFGDGSRLGIRLIHITEQEPLGTCGAVKNVEKFLGDDPVIVCNGDILTDLDISALVSYHNEKKATVTITLTPVEDPTAYGLVPLEPDGRIKEFVEKPSWDQVVTNLINAGTYVIDPEVFKQVPPGQNYSFERELFPRLLKQGVPMYGFPSDCYWLDLGTPAKYLKAHHDIMERKIEIPLRGNEISEMVFCGEGVKIDKTARINPPCVLGDRVRIASHASVGSLCCLGNDVVVEEGANIEGSVILDRAKIGKDCIIESAIVGKNTVLGPRVHVAEVAVLGDNIVAEEDNEFRHGIRVWPSTRIEAGKIRFYRTG